MPLDPKWCRGIKAREKFGKCCVCRSHPPKFHIVLEAGNDRFEFGLCSAWCAFRLGEWTAIEMKKGGSDVQAPRLTN